MSFFHYYHKFLKVLLITTLALLTIVVTYQMLSRNVEAIPRFSSTEEISRWIFVWLVFIGAAVGVRENEHFLVDLFPANSFVNKYLDLLSIIVIGLVSILLIVMGIDFFQSGLNRFSPVSGLSLGFPYLSVPFSGFSMLIFTIEKLLLFNKKPEGQDHLERILKEEEVE